MFISHNRVKEGKLEALRRFTAESTPSIEADKPGTVLLYGYLNEEGTEVDFVHVFPGANAMDAHFVGADERSRAAFEFIESMGFEIYGAPSEEALAALRQSGLDVRVRPQPLGGYIHLQEG